MNTRSFSYEKILHQIKNPFLLFQLIASIASLHADTLERKWTWIDGFKEGGEAGRYGQLGCAHPDNWPGARDASATFSDRRGNLWLFGGYGYDSQKTLGPLNDLWMYNGRTWKWISGSDLVYGKASYGKLRAKSDANVPGPREYMGFGTRPSGLWVFGGQGHDKTGKFGLLNDLWRFNGKRWQWIDGADVVNQAGRYGKLGKAHPNNTPGGRYALGSGVDRQHRLWVFGGEGYDESGKRGLLNDVWRNRNGSWSWVGGEKTTNAKGVYSGDPATFAPGSRRDMGMGIDSHGSLWVFGGDGFDGDGRRGLLNDLWRYKNGKWTWISGSSRGGYFGKYGKLGVGTPAGMPTARQKVFMWLDRHNHIWIFGGYGLDESGRVGYLNNIWRFDGKNWIWESGESAINVRPVYGVEGVPDWRNGPGSKRNPAAWVTKTGLWLFGGFGAADVGPFIRTSDLWLFQY